MPKAPLTVATKCRYGNKPHGMKAGNGNTLGMDAKRFPNYSCRIFVPFSFINDSSFPFYYFVPIWQTKATFFSLWLFAEGQARTSANGIRPLRDSLSGCCAVSLPPHGLVPFYNPWLVPFYSLFHNLTVPTALLEGRKLEHTRHMPREFPNFVHLFSVLFPKPFLVPPLMHRSQFHPILL